jgi:hypothetical protein
VEEIPSSQSTPLVPPPDFSKYSSRLDSHSDYHVCVLSPPLHCPKDLVETFSESSNDFSDDDSLYSKDIKFVDASLPHSEIVNLEGDVDHVVSTTYNTTITNPLFEFGSEFTLNSVNPVFDSDESETETIMDEVHVYIPQSTAHVPPPYTFHEEFSSELTHITSPPECDNLDGKENHDRGERISIMRVCIDDKIPILPPELLSKPHSSTNKIQISATALDLEEEDQIMIFIMVFFLFFTYLVTSSLLHSFGSEDTIFDPGIFIYHF